MQTKYLNFFLVIAFIFYITTCSNIQITANRGFSAIAPSQKITLYSLNNYTDTLRADLRAANITTRPAPSVGLSGGQQNYGSNMESETL